MKRKIKMRKFNRYFLIIISIVLIVLSSSTLFTLFSNNTIEKKKQTIYTYENQFKCDYDIELVGNDFIDENSLPLERTYVTDLINNINMNLKYNYTVSKNIEVDYTYEIIGLLTATYTGSGTTSEIWRKQYILLPSQNASSTNGKLAIDENIIVDIQTYNQHVKNFEQSLGFTVDATFTIMLKVQTKANINDDILHNTYSSNIAIGLGKKITQINGKLTDSKIGDETIIVNENGKVDRTSLVKNITLLIAGLMTLFYIITKTVESRIVNSDYTVELNKILRTCQDKIVQVNNKLDINEDDAIEVKDFGELIKLSEELFKPILYWNSRNEESYFYVISNNVTYRHILKA